MNLLHLNGEPYLYQLLEKHFSIYSQLHGSLIAQPGDYLLLDRWFDAVVVNEKQMDQLIEAGKLSSLTDETLPTEGEGDGDR